MRWVATLSIAKQTLIFAEGLQTQIGLRLSMADFLLLSLKLTGGDMSSGRSTMFGKMLIQQ